MVPCSQHGQPAAVAGVRVRVGSAWLSRWPQTSTKQRPARGQSPSKARPAQRRITVREIMEHPQIRADLSMAIWPRVALKFNPSITAQS